VLPTKSLLTLAIGILIAAHAPAQGTVYSNGGFVTGVGNGFGGADTSELEISVPGPPGQAHTPYGVLRHHGLVNASIDEHLADDFSVPPGKIWSLSVLKWYGYQVFAPAAPTSTITDVRLRVWDRRPDLSGAVVLYGDTQTNRLLSSSLTNCYRVKPVSPADPNSLTNDSRAIFELQIDVSWIPPLSAGTYWLDFMGVGDSGLLGPFTIPTVPWLSTNNAEFFLPVFGEWRPTTAGVGSTPCDIPFRLTGFETGVPNAYCTAKSNSQSCVPDISSTGLSSAASATGFVVRSINNLNGKPGLLLYGSTGRASGPFGGGVLCINAPLRRSTTLNSGGTTAPPLNCTGIYSIDMNAFAAGSLGGNPLPALKLPGTIVDCQFWGRDQGFAPPNNVSLSNALEYQVGP
jgi:hypothetical protein